MTIWHMRIAFWITKAANSHSQYVIAFHLQQWLHEFPTMSRYTYIACLDFVNFVHLASLPSPISARRMLIEPFLCFEMDVRISLTSCICMWLHVRSMADVFGFSSCYFYDTYGHSLFLLLSFLGASATMQSSYLNHVNSSSTCRLETHLQSISKIFTSYTTINTKIHTIKCYKF